MTNAFEYDNMYSYEQQTRKKKEEKKMSTKVNKKLTQREFIIEQINSDVLNRNHIYFAAVGRMWQELFLLT